MLFPSRPLPDDNWVYYEVVTWYRRIDQAGETMDRCVRITTKYRSLIEARTWMVIAAQERCSEIRVRSLVRLTDRHAYEIRRRFLAEFAVRRKQSNKTRKLVASRKRIDSIPRTMI